MGAKRSESDAGDYVVGATVTHLPHHLGDQVEALGTQIANLRVIVMNQDRELTELRAASSARRTFTWRSAAGVLFVCTLILTFVTSLSTVAPPELVGLGNLGFIKTLPWGIDAILHFVGWMAAMVLGGLAVRTRPLVIALAAILQVCGVTLEALQGAFTAKRNPEWADVLANTSGIIAGLCVLAVLEAGLAVGNRVAKRQASAR